MALNTLSLLLSILFSFVASFIFYIKSLPLSGFELNIAILVRLVPIIIKVTVILVSVFLNKKHLLPYSFVFLTTE